jgi:DNA-binding response OmpR family regulator
MSRVLVVEDNLDLTNLVRSLLEFENHSVDIFHTGTEGLANILANPYDLVILDWDLSGVSGLEILRQFRQTGAKTPVIMLTGRSTVEDMEAGLDEGADDCLAKPFSMKELGCSRAGPY